jgi:ribosome-binding factor A
VWITALQAEQAPEALKALKELTGELRHALAHGMRLRRVPELRVKYDDSVDKGERIESLLRRDALLASPGEAADEDASSSD